MSWVITGAGKTPTLFQIAGAPNAAYSLRQLDSSVISVVRIRRSSDNTEQDFTAAQVTDGTLTTFCGAGDGFVRTWYDQSGNGKHAEQTTTGNQPKLVASGQLVTDQGKPALDFDGNTQRLSTTLAENQSYTLFSVAKGRTVSGAGRLFGFGALRSFGTFGTGNTWGYYANSVGATTSFTGYGWSTRTLIYLQLNAQSNSTFAGNGGSTISFTPSNDASSPFGIGDRDGLSGGNQSDVLVQELVYYGANQSTYRTAIESNINTYYAVY